MRRPLSTLHEDAKGAYFDLARVKTAKRAFATITQKTAKRHKTYLREFGVVIPPNQPFIRNRSGRAYTKDTLARDFRRVRNKLFPGDDRILLDMRRTGNVEAAVGGALPTDMSAKAGNSIDKSNRLFETYTPVQLEAVRRADRARERGRRKLAGNKKG